MTLMGGALPSIVVSEEISNAAASSSPWKLVLLTTSDGHLLIRKGRGRLRVDDIQECHDLRYVLEQKECLTDTLLWRRLNIPVTVPLVVDEREDISTLSSVLFHTGMSGAHSSDEKED